MDPAPLPLAETIRAGRDRDGGRIAMVHEDVALGYDRVLADVERIAGKLLELGIAPGDIVAVHVGKPVTHWMVTLGLMRVGAVSLSLTRNALNELAALDGVSAVICGAGDEGAFPETLWRIAVTRDWLARPRPGAGVLPPPDTAARTVGRICFTSGTSGRPKAILLDARLLAARLAGTARRAGIDSETTLWCGLGPDTAYGFTATLATWLVGGTVFLSTGAAGAFGEMHRRGVNLLIASPAALGPVIRDAARSELPRLDGPAVAAGGRLSAALRDELLRHVCTGVRVAYGSSEAGGVTFGDAAALDAHPGRVGAVFRDIAVEIVDEAGAPLPPGREGRLRIRTESTVPGYLNDTEASAAYFEDGWFYPGDIAALSADGVLTLLGRKAQILNLGGVKIPVEELEERLCRFDGVDDACAFLMARGRPEPDLIFVVVAPGTTRAALGPAVRAAFPQLPPVHLFAAPQLPRGSMGKVRKPEVAEAVRAAFEGAGAHAGSGLEALGTV